MERAKAATPASWNAMWRMSPFGAGCSYHFCIVDAIPIAPSTSTSALTQVSVATALSPVAISASTSRVA
jgi:hypothetical protein